MPLLSLADEYADQFTSGATITDAMMEKLPTDWQKPNPETSVTTSDDVALIRVWGCLVDRRSLGELLGCETSYESIGAALQWCKQLGMRKIALDVNSPGGYASGVANLVQTMLELRQEGFRITAIVNSLCCSAAYRIACACDEIVALPESIVGSIGVNYIITDTSRQAAMRGQETVVISTSDYKWAGTPGAPVTDKQKENIRVNMVEPFFETFCREVQTARKLNDKELKAVADGRSFRAEQALELKLIDRISTFADAIGAVGGPNMKGLMTMAAKKETIEEKAVVDQPQAEQTPPQPEQSKPVPATLDQLDEKFPRATAEFKLEQLRQKATLDAAKDAYISMLEKQLEDKPAPIPAPVQPIPAPAQSAPVQLPGSPAMETAEPSMPTVTAAAEEKSATDKLNELIAQKVKAGQTPQEAAAAVFHECPELRQEWIKGFNASK